MDTPETGKRFAPRFRLESSRPERAYFFVAIHHGTLRCCPVTFPGLLPFTRKATRFRNRTAPNVAIFVSAGNAVLTRMCKSTGTLSLGPG
jgi:hypothetical protein